MNILVAKNGSQLGPFSESDIRTKLASGELAPSDFGWKEGMAAWSPLSQMLDAAPSQPAPPPAAPSYAPPGQNAPAAYSPQPQAQPYAPQPYNAPQGQYSAPQTYNSPYPSPYQQGGAPPWGTQGAGNNAGFWLRVVAFIIDYIVIIIPVYLILFVLKAIGLDQMGASLVSNVISLFGGWLFYAGLESSAYQATPGKMALGLKVTDENGSRIGFGQATGRHFGKIVSGIILGVGFIMAGFTQRKQALHDIMAHTLVVRK